MTIRVAIRHKTVYEFDRPVNISPHVLRLRPAPHSRTPTRGYTLKVHPEKHFINWQQDPFGNYQARLVFPDKATRLEFDVEVISEMTAYNPFDFFVEDYAKRFPFEYDTQTKRELEPYLECTESGALFADWLATVPKRSMPIIDFLVLINQRLERDIEYTLRFEPGVQTPEKTLSLAKGSCRDSAWLLVQLLRHLGLASRFVSGYLVQLTADQPSLDGPSGPAEDFTDLHAWTEVYLPGAGWVGLDPTSGLFANESHIPLACTPDPISAAPITGATDKCEVTFSYQNTVDRILEDPRVTKPYTEEQWRDIFALGQKVDSEFVSNDVRLTMGGEPTFVSIDDMDSAQWNTEALGEEKLKLAKDLLLRLRDRFAPQGLLHYGQGKWYPGEEIPRWALGCFWRKDGESLWQRQELLAQINHDYGFDVASAREFASALADKLGLLAEYVQPAFEDALYYVWKEQSLPTEIDPYEADISDGLERMRLARVLSQGLDTATGFVIPLAWNYSKQGWMSSRWELRAGRVILIPGDSPMGLRLPLDALPPPTDYDYATPQDPFDTREALGPPTQFALSAATSKTSIHLGDETTARSRATVSGGLESQPFVRTSLCIEPRNGRLHVFLPPVDYLEHYIALTGAIEITAGLLNMPVVIEGYEPPRDPRLQKLLVTPDPGVIEVNIHPAANWRELVDNTLTLYEEARQARLGTEKFMLDGRHGGTGGGNHITIGGVTPADSPLLQRPDLLRSLVTYWQHHPGLSYLFSGMFIGPTSQAPRADEGRGEMLYEMEIAFQQMPEGAVDRPWLIDRLMRNLLIDVTGNTHRAEFCIDKLYAPGSSAGRQGILEFRGFEMPPHPRMALVQALLLRSLVARFWNKPYHKPLARWGTLLHDRFMLPHYVWADIRDVVAELRSHGYPFQLEWLQPFEEFRFPHYGRLDLGDIQLELRWAIEPWHVLGEEVGSFGTARYVDSSVERLQVKMEGISDDRYVLACNGRRVPLRSTGQHGQKVAGVRYKAWQPPSALHPTIGVHAPLRFDVIDTWNGRSIGGCTYHVSHAGGRSYDSLPVNAAEAESRRVNRFWDYNHTPGPIITHPDQNLLRNFYPDHAGPKPMAPPVEEIDNEYPHTLDLRRRPTS